MAFFLDKPEGTTISFSVFPAVINQSVTITCASNGLHEPNFIIFHNDTKVTNNMTYTIFRVKRTHTGTYKCVANNSLGNDSSSRFLPVNGKILFYINILCYVK